MKYAKLAQRLPHLLLGGLITGLLVASTVALPATPAQAANQYFYDYSIAEDLSFQGSYYAGEKKELSNRYETEDSNKICEKLKSEERRYTKEYKNELKESLGIPHQQVDNCRFQGSLFFIYFSGKYDEKLLKTATSEYALKITDKDELILLDDLPSGAENRDLEKIGKRENIGIQRHTFPGKIKRVTPDIGKISGNTWVMDKALTTTEEEKLEKTGGTITIISERHGSKLGLILGITIPAALVIVAVIVMLIVKSKRKKKQQNLPPYPAGYGTYPPPPFMPGNPVQPPMPGYPPSGTPGAPGAAPYPPNVPPQGQAGVPVPGGYYPYQYPYPYPPAGHPMPPQVYGTPTSGFPPFSPPVQPEPAEGSEKSEPAAGSHSGKHVATSPQPGQSGQPAKSPTPPPSEEVGKPGNPDKSNQDTDSSKPRHAFEPEQSDLTVLSTDSSKLMRPRHSTPVNQVEQPGQED